MGSSSTAASGSKRSSMTPCCSKLGLKRGPWTPEEDETLASYVRREGEGKWRTLPKRAGLLRCGKSCRLRWMNYLKPSVKRGHIAADEEDLILRLHRLLGNRWSLIAGRIPGRTDNEIKNYWNTHLRKKLISNGIDPRTHKPLNPRHCLSHKTPTPNPNPNSEKPCISEPPKAMLSSCREEGGNTGLKLGEDDDVGSMGFLSEEQFSSFLDSFIDGDDLIRCDRPRAEEELPDRCEIYGNGSSGVGYEDNGSLWDAVVGFVEQSEFININGDDEL